MAGISYNQARCLQTDPVLQEVVKCSDKNLPELLLLPNATTTGTRYEFWQRTKKIDKPIFVKECEGVFASTAGWEKTSRELKKVMTKMESCEGALQADDNGVTQPTNVWDENRSEEMANFNRRLVRALYVKESDSAAPTLDDFVTIKVNALDGDWNADKDLVADPNAPTAPEIASLGGLTSIYLVYASTAGLHWEWGNNRMFNFGAEQFVDIRDEKRSQETGENCTYPGIVQYADGYVAPVNKCQYDVVKIVNVPLKLGVDGFNFDAIIERVVPLVYESATNQPNLVLTSTKVLSNWRSSRKKEAIAAGGVTYTDISGAPQGTRFTYFEDLDLVIGASSCMPINVPFEAGTVLAEQVTDELGDLITV